MLFFQKGYGSDQIFGIEATQAINVEMPIVIFGRDLFWWLTKTRILDRTVDSRLGRKLRTRDTLIGSSPRQLQKRYGVELKPRLLDADGRTARFGDASELEVDAVIWATGYRADYSWIKLPISPTRTGAYVIVAA